MNIEPKIIAEFARIAIEYDLLSTNGVRLWGDSLLKQVDESPLWMIEIAMISPRKANRVLASVPGSPNSQKSAELTFALLQRKWQEKKVSIETVRRVAWNFHLADLVPLSANETSNWGLILEIECEGLDEGWRSKSDIGKLITESLLRYNQIAEQLPDWVDIL